VVAAAGGEHAERGLDRVVLADEVEHRLGTRPAGQLAHALDLPAVGRDPVMRAALLGQLQRLRVAVDGDDHGRGQGDQALDPDVAQAAGPDHHDAVPGFQGRQLLADRVVGAQAPVGQGGHVGRLDPGVEW
jgi:hypothetical protein